MSEKINVYLERIDNGYLEPLREGLDFIGLRGMVGEGDAIFIKPNLTFPCYRQGVMTNPECIEQLVIALKDYSSNITIGESDGGGYNRFAMEDVFSKTSLADLATRHGVRLLNLSRLPSRNIRFHYQGREFAVPLPAMLLDEVRLFITIPVPKVHANTGVSMSVKNQWGCIQDPSLRLRLHPFFKKVIFEINRALNVRLSVIDGKFGLNRNGPLRGDPVPLGWVMVADDIVTADHVCCHLMGIDPRGVDYLDFCHRNWPVPEMGAIRFNKDYQNFIGPRFLLRREFWDYPGYLAFRSSTLAYLAYHSPIAGLLHRGMYMFREKFYDHS